MTMIIDDEVAAALTALVEQAGGELPAPPPGDIEARREMVHGLMAIFAAGREIPSGVDVKDFAVTTADGAELLLRWYAPSDRPAEGGPAVYYIHGGGMICSTAAMYDVSVGLYAAESGVPFLSVDYRLAPENPHPGPVEDCYAGLVWLSEHAADLGVDPARIAVMGDSAGGGLAASLAILARDRGGPALSRQVLIYPMLDDRNVVPDEQLVPFATWTYDDNVTGWGALLGDAVGGSDVSPYAAAARLTDFAGLPPTYVEVGDLDVFRDEDIAFARRCAAAGVPTELHVHPGVPHAFEGFAPDSDVAQRAMADRFRVLRTL